MQPKGMGRQTRSDDSGARNWGLLTEWNRGDAILVKQERVEVVYGNFVVAVYLGVVVPCACQTCARHTQASICRAGPREIGFWGGGGVVFGKHKVADLAQVQCPPADILESPAPSDSPSL